MADFDVYAFADYSGATAVRQQRKHIVLATLRAERDEIEGVTVATGHDGGLSGVGTQTRVVPV